MRKTQLVITEPFEKLKGEKITFSWTTLLRLQRLGGDATALYIHYCSTARLQSKAFGRYSNTIKATSSYAMAGLNLTRKRFAEAKKILLDNGFIEDYKPRNEKGQVIGHYIKIHYFFKNVVLDSDNTNEIHPTENQEGGLSAEWENQTVENITTNTNDKNRNTINKKRNTTNEKIIKIKTTPEENTLADNEHQTRMTTQTDATVRGLLPEEKQAQEIIDAIKTHCGLDLKDKQKWKRQIGQIAEVQNELHRHSKDFVNCVKTLIQNPYYKEISLNLVLKKIRLMPIQLEQLQNENNTENIGYSEDEVFTALFEQNAKAYGTTPEYERAKDELEQKFIHSVMDSGRHRPTDAERVEHKEDLKKLKQNMLGNYKTA